VPYLFLLTVSTGVLMFIPFFGPPLALVPVVLVALAFRPFSSAMSKSGPLEFAVHDPDESKVPRW